MKSVYRTWIPVYFCLAAFCAFAETSAAEGVVHLEPQELYSHSDLVVLGEIVSLERTPDRTRAQIRVLRAFKGPAGTGSLVAVESLGGRVFIEENEPNFMASQVNLLYLQQNAQGGHYRCTNRADGQKIIRNKNLYPYHDNSLHSIPVDGYLKELEALQKAYSETLNQSAKPASSPR